MSFDDERLARRLQLEEESLSNYGDMARISCSNSDMHDIDLARLCSETLYLSEHQIGNIGNRSSYTRSNSDTGASREGARGSIIHSNNNTEAVLSGEFPSDYYSRVTTPMDGRHQQTRSLTLGRSYDQQQPGFESRTLRTGGMQQQSPRGSIAARGNELQLRLQSLEEDVAREHRRSFTATNSDIDYSFNNHNIHPGPRRGSLHESHPRRDNTSRMSLPPAADLEYARRLQEIAFSDLQRQTPTSYNSMPRITTANNNSSSLGRNAIVDPDEEIARKMQELEDRGLGRMNSDDELSDSDSERENRKFAMPGQLYGLKSPATHSLEKKDAKLARFMQETEASFSQIAPDVLSDVLGALSSHSQLVDSLQIFPSRLSNSQTNSVPESAPQRSSLKADITVADDARSRILQEKLHGTKFATENNTEMKEPETVPDSSQHTILMNGSFHELKNSSGLSPSDEPRRTSVILETCSESPDKEAPLADSAIRKKRVFLSFGKREKSKKDVTASTMATSMGFLVGMSPLRSPKKITKLPSLLTDSSPVSSSTKWSSRSSSVPPTKRFSEISSNGVANGVVPPLSIPPPPAPGVPLPINIPRGIPPPPPGPPPGSHPSFGLTASQPVNGYVRLQSVKPKFTCAGCGLSHGSFLQALDKKYHAECFKCFVCNGKIDPNSQFKFSSDPLGQKHAHHVECSLRLTGIQCTVCRKAIPASYDGKISFVKHPFFTTEHMCVHHAEVPHRRCSGCQRFEPRDKPFIDLMDGNRCVCPACCRTVIFDSTDAEPLWKQVIYFLEFKLKLPVWDEMKEIPILLVGSDELASQMRAERSIHAHSTQIMASGLCLTAPANGPEGKAAVVAILCLSGLPRDLTLSILSREATLAWFKLHPRYDLNNPLPVQVEEGIAQLIAFLFLSEAMSIADADVCPPIDDGDGPSDEKLRQYFKFSIERESHEVYGTGYRKAAVAYRDIGIEELLDYVIKYRDFPRT